MHGKSCNLVPIAPLDSYTCMLYSSSVSSEFHILLITFVNSLDPNQDRESVSPGPEVIKLFSCSTQLSTKFQLLINLKYRQIKKFLGKSFRHCIYHANKCKMPTTVGILTFMSRINFVLS